MSARRFALFAALALFIAFIAVNVTANSWFRSWRGSHGEPPLLAEPRHSRRSTR